MAATAPPKKKNVLSPYYDCFFEAASLAEGARPRPPKPGTRARTSHYRPFSTLYTDSPYVEPGRLKRASSIGGLHFAAMGLNFTNGKEKGKAKEEPAPSARSSAGASEFGMFKTPGRARLPRSPLGGDTLPQRPSTSSGVTTVRASPATSTSNPKNTFFRMKKKRSMASIFSSAPSESVSGTGSSSGISNPATMSSPDLPGSPGSTSSVFSSPGSTSSGGTSSTFTTTTASSPLAASHHVIAPSPRSDSGATIKTSGHNKAVVDGDANILDLDRAFVRKTNWAMRQNMTMHPYQDEYPYMRSYDPVLLESDRHTDMLLQHLSQGAPSFHDYRTSPSTVLDLGCGVGHWALHAASVWKNSQITAFDLVNITNAAFDYTENLLFVQGSFLDNPLPFADGSFEYVRMANLILCIPHDRWSAVLSEVYRVLAPGGRLEVVDDEMRFPYADKPRERRKRHGKKRSVSSFEESDSDASDNLFEDSRPKRSDDDSTETESTFFSETSSRPTSFDSKGSHNGSLPLLQTPDKEKEEEDEETGLSESVTVRPISAMIGRGPISAFLPPTPPFATPPEPAVFRNDKRPAATTVESYQPHAHSPQALWERQAWASRDMERIFDMMLGQTYGIFPRFSDRIVDLMQGVFGEGAAGKVSSFHVKLAPADSPIGAQGRARAALETMEEVFDMKKGWKMTTREKEKEKDKERDRKNSGTKKDELSKGDSPTASATASKRSSMDASMMLSTPLPASLNAKAAARLGLPSTTNIKAAHRLGYDLSPDKPSFTTDKNKKLPKAPYDKVDSSDDEEETPAGNKDRSPSPRPPSIKTSYSPPSSSPPTPTTLTPNTPIAATSTIPISGAAPAPTPTFNLPPAPLVINAKAAMRLGIQPTPGEKMVKTPGTGQSHSPQSPGLLIWPSTYIAMSPVELEMHACKNVHTLLGCRPALYEFVRRQTDKEGQRLASDDEFADAVWEYECFRRSRLNWPSAGMNPYGGDTTSSGTETVNIKNDTILPMGNQDSFNGQYLRNSLVHLRTIRVFSAVKAYVEDKSPAVPSSKASSPPSSFRPPRATPMAKSRSDSSRA